MKKQNHNIPPGKAAEQVAFLGLLKERSGERLTRLEAYLDLVDKAAAQYIPKDLQKNDFALTQGLFVVTITELAECWHWHRATVRSFIEQLEALGQIKVVRLPKSQIITISSFVAEPVVSPFDVALSDFRHTLTEALTAWNNGKMSTSECAAIYRKAKRCGLSISGYIRSRALDYEPSVRLSTEEKQLLANLAAARTDIVNFSNALHGLAEIEKFYLFRDNRRMEEWYRKVAPVSEAVNRYLQCALRNKPFAPGTSNTNNHNIDS